ERIPRPPDPVSEGRPVFQGDSAGPRRDGDEEARRSGREHRRVAVIGGLALWAARQADREKDLDQGERENEEGRTVDEEARGNEDPDGGQHGLRPQRDAGGRSSAARAEG